jgi:hypothetical protein
MTHYVSRVGVAAATTGPVPASARHLRSAPAHDQTGPLTRRQHFPIHPVRPQRNAAAVLRDSGVPTFARIPTGELVLDPEVALVLLDVATAGDVTLQVQQEGQFRCR